MKTLYLDRVGSYTTLVVELEEFGASVAGWGLRADEYFGLVLPDNERLLLAAALLRPGEHVERLTEDVSEMRRTKEQEDNA